MTLEALFLRVLNMSITGGIVIIAILLIRFFLKKAPKSFSLVLWSVAAFRLVCPVSFSSVISLFRLRPLILNPAQAASPYTLNHVPPDIGVLPSLQIASGLGNIDQVHMVPLPVNPTASVNPIQIWTAIAAFVWLAGIGALLIYSLVSYLRVRRLVTHAVRLDIGTSARPGGFSAKAGAPDVYETDSIPSPFVLGFLKPRIFLPFRLGVAEREYILRHEYCHIRRRDHLVKPLAFLIASLHWFNPLVWVAFRQMGCDMEMSCDEAVLRQMGPSLRHDYSQSLLALATRRRFPVGYPLAFGESNVRQRILNVLNYRRPRFWILALSLVLCMAVILVCATNPQDTSPTGTPSSVNPANGPTTGGEPSASTQPAATVNPSTANPSTANPSATSEPNFWPELKQVLITVWHGEQLTRTLTIREDDRLKAVGNMVFTSMVKSAGGPPVNPATLKDCIRFRMYGKQGDQFVDLFPEEYYVFEKAGQAFIQYGVNGRTTPLDSERYQSFAAVAVGLTGLLDAGMELSLTLTVRSGNAQTYALPEIVESYDHKTKQIRTVPKTLPQDKAGQLNSLIISQTIDADNPFVIFVNGKRTYGTYTLYDEQYREVPFPMPSGRAPQTWIFRNTAPGRYIVRLETSIETEQATYTCQYFFEADVLYRFTAEEIEQAKGVVRAYYAALVSKDKDALLKTLTERYHQSEHLFGTGKIKLLDVRYNPDDPARVSSSGSQSPIPGVDPGNILVLRTDYQVTEPAGNGAAAPYTYKDWGMILVREGSDKPWRIANMGY